MMLFYPTVDVVGPPEICIHQMWISAFRSVIRIDSSLFS